MTNENLGNQYLYALTRQSCSVFIETGETRAYSLQSQKISMLNETMKSNAELRRLDYEFDKLQERKPPNSDDASGDSNLELEIACQYCGLEDKKFLAKCVRTNKWFCNAKSKGDKSHIVAHLNTISSDQVELYQEDTDNATICCEQCKIDNVFALRYYPVISKTFCRYECGEKFKKEQKEWYPVIQNNEIYNSILKIPPKDKLLKEISLKKMREISVGCSPDKGKYEKYNPIKVELCYSSKEEYKSVYIQLITSMRSAKAKSSLPFIIEGVEVHKDDLNEFMISCEVPQNYFTRISNRKIATVIHEDTDYIGGISTYPSIEDYLEIILNEELPSENAICDILFADTMVNFRRMHMAVRSKGLKQLPEEFFDPKNNESTEDDICQVKTTILGCPESTKLNDSQKFAIKKILNRGNLTLIKGPPGTGKTTTIAALVHELLRKEGKILVVAPSNTATDKLCAMITESIKNKKSVVRLCAKTYRGDTKIKNYFFKPNKNKNFGKDRLKNADVICTTCVMSGHEYLDEIEFQTVIIDESNQAIEPELLIPIVKSPHKIILVGDNCQLGPLIGPKAKRNGSAISLFERLILAGKKSILLNTQYRMDPGILEFPNRVFYENKIVNAVKKSREINFPWPNREVPTFFWAVVGAEEYAVNGKSRMNELEVQKSIQVLQLLTQSGVQPSDIGVLTPYNGQVAFMRKKLKEVFKDKFREHIHSIDSIQGSERDFIIFSCVRSNESGGIGFLGDPRRLNVAITRARFGLIIIGSPDTLVKSDIWRELLYSYQSKGLLVQGELKRWEKYEKKIEPLPEPYKYTPGLEYRK